MMRLLFAINDFDEEVVSYHSWEVYKTLIIRRQSRIAYCHHEGPPRFRRSSGSTGQCQTALHRRRPGRCTWALAVASITPVLQLPYLRGQSHQ